jgi:predicted O-methyltransferase YrrM
MSRPEKLNVFIGVPSYGGNGGIASEHPDVRDWLIKTIVTMKADPRIGKVVWHTFNDTPITMVRNEIVECAKEQDCQILVMVDSDQAPDLYLGKDPDAKPFWQTSFEKIWEHYEKGPIVIGAPYCGPPPHPTHGGGESVYVFTWVGMEASTYGGRAFTTPVMNQISRPQANMMSGIQECAALPTGVIAYDMRCFDHIEHPYFDYEWSDKTRRKKASTEDVYNTRNISLAIMLRLGYNPCFCNWDAWAGHWKPKCVGRPYALTVEAVAENLREAVLDGVSNQEKLVTVNYGAPDEPKSEPQWAERHGEAHGVEVPDEDWKTQEHLLRKITAARSDDTPFIIVEVGTWVGNNAVRMSDLLDSLGVEHRIFCVDTFAGSRNDVTGQIADQNGGSMYRQFLANTQHKGAKIISIIADSLKGPSKVPFDADYIFIDADHDFEAVAADIATWWPKLKDGGFIVGHDYACYPGVQGAWEDVVVGRWGIPLDTDGGNVCWVQKPVEELVGAEG